MKRALVSAFEPFGGDKVNASLAAVRRLSSSIGELDITTLQLPTSYARSFQVLESAIRRHRPRLVLCVGQAAERGMLSLERIAINVQDARLADNDGARPLDTAVKRRGPAAYFSTLPIRPALKSLQQAGLPAEISNSAGTFVCNHVFYCLMHLAVRRKSIARAGLLHVPRLADAARSGNAPGMALEDIVRAIEIVVLASQ